jgi:hypothetical protein
MTNKRSDASAVNPSMTMTPIASTPRHSKATVPIEGNDPIATGNKGRATVVEEVVQAPTSLFDRFEQASSTLNNDSPSAQDPPPKCSNNKQEQTTLTSSDYTTQKKQEQQNNKKKELKENKNNKTQDTQTEQQNKADAMEEDDEDANFVLILSKLNPHTTKWTTLEKAFKSLMPFMLSDKLNLEMDLANSMKLFNSTKDILSRNEWTQIFIKVHTA